MANIQDELAEIALQEIAAIWKVDQAKSIRRDDGFDWWPGDYRVSVSAWPRKDGQQPATTLVSIRTDFLKDVPINDSKFVRLAAMSSRFFTSTYAWVYPPAEVWAEHAEPGATPRLWSANTAYVTPHNKDWLPAFIARTSIMQPINAQIQAAQAPEFLGGGAPDLSRPAGLAPGLDGMLELVAQAYVSLGNEANRWVGTGEFQKIAENWGQSDYSFGFGDDGGLTLETPFGDDSALIRLKTDERHPQLGNGLLCTLQLPFSDEPTRTAEECAFLNLLETFWTETEIPLLGCWHPHISRGGLEGPAFTSFVPNALYQPGIASHMTLWLLERASWIRKKRWPHLQDKTMLEILQKRLSVAGEAASAPGHLTQRLD
jgi:hypothetical protein